MTILWRPPVSGGRRSLCARASKEGTPPPEPRPPARRGFFPSVAAIVRSPCSDEGSPAIRQSAQPEHHRSVGRAQRGDRCFLEASLSPHASARGGRAAPCCRDAGSPPPCPSRSPAILASSGASAPRPERTPIAAPARSLPLAPPLPSSTILCLWVAPL